MANQPTTVEVRSYIDKLERTINEWEIMPSTSLYRSAVLLALLSKSLVFSRAICALVDAGFGPEGFGMSRTLIEIFFCIRYIGNQDTEKRAQTYVEYAARVRQEWQTVIPKYYPSTPKNALKLDAEVIRTAGKFSSRGLWTGHGGQAKLMAMEPDPDETNDQGDGLADSFDYDVLYFWTSQFVHVTVEALGDHALPPGEVFRVHAKYGRQREWEHFALVNIVTMLCKIFVRACRAMNLDQPNTLNELFEYMKSMNEADEPNIVEQ